MLIKSNAYSSKVQDIKANRFIKNITLVTSLSC